VRRLSAEEKAALLSALREGTQTQTALAKQFGISKGTLSRYVRKLEAEEGVQAADVRMAVTARATETKRMEDDRKHLELLDGLRDDAVAYRGYTKAMTNQLLGDMAVARSAGGPMPLDREGRLIRNLATIMAITIDKYRIVRDMSQARGVEEGASLLEQLVGGLKDDPPTKPDDV